MEPNKGHVEETPKSESSDGLYRVPAIHVPSFEKVKSLAEELKFDLTQGQIEEITGVLPGLIEPYEELYRMVEPKPPVKYPRTPGYRPAPEENQYNAWYIKTDIHGAPTGKLAGKKVAIKDNIAVAGVPMMNGTKWLEGYTPDYDATVVTRVLDAGGRIMGKAACEHLCFSGNSFTNDIAPVSNPLDPSVTTGGSSSGCGALLVTGEVDLAIGGDQGGSIRMPASWCGFVGLKPTHGLVPYTGAMPIEPTVDFLGPMAKNVPDCALFLEVLAGYDGMDYRQPEYFPKIPEYSKMLMDDLSGMKLGIVKEGFKGCDDEVNKVVMEAAKNLSIAGALVEEVTIPMHTKGHAIWSPVVTEGGYETMVNRGGYGPSSKGFHDTNMMAHISKSMKTSMNDLSTVMKVVCILCKYIQESNNYSYYCRGSNLVMKLTEAYDIALMDYDALIMPTLPFIAPKLPQKDAPISDLLRLSLGMVQNTAPFNATGHPALSVNAGYVGHLPVGMMIIGKKWQEQKVLNVAYAHEKIQAGK